MNKIKMTGIAAMGLIGSLTATPQAHAYGYDTSWVGYEIRLNHDEVEMLNNGAGIASIFAEPHVQAVLSVVRFILYVECAISGHKGVNVHGTWFGLGPFVTPRF